MKKNLLIVSAFLTLCSCLSKHEGVDYRISIEEPSVFHVSLWDSKNEYAIPVRQTLHYKLKKGEEYSVDVRPIEFTSTTEIIKMSNVTEEHPTFLNLAFPVNSQRLDLNAYSNQISEGTELVITPKLNSKMRILIEVEREPSGDLYAELMGLLDGCYFVGFLDNTTGKRQELTNITIAKGQLIDIPEE